MAEDSFHSIPAFLVLTSFYCLYVFSYRLRREYLKLDFEQLLAEKGIDPNILIPRHPSNGGEHVTTTDNPVSPHLPLEVSLSLLQSFFSVWVTNSCCITSGLSITTHSSLLCSSFRYLTMRTTTAGPQKTGLPSAKRRDQLI